MNVTDPLVLRKDVLLLPVADLAPEVREKLTFDDGDFAVSRTHGRALSQVVDGETASLLQLFLRPRTIVDAVIESSRALKKDPQVWLDEVLPFIGVFVQNRVLVSADAEVEEEFAQTVANGERIGSWEVSHCASLVEDTEIYRVSDGLRDAALKISRQRVPFDHSVFGNEARILESLDGVIAPRLYESGMHEERPYLVIEWCAGVDGATAAARRRHDRVATLELACAIAGAYAALHERSIVHGDVHPRNIVVSDDGAVRLIDFGLASVNGEAPIVRGGMYYFFEPELIRAQRAGTSRPATYAGEQYSIAALLVLLITGNHYLDFRYEREEMARQIETESPLPFSKRGLPPWPEVEAVLVRALEKNPDARYPSVRELVAALERARQGAVAEALATPVSPQTRAFAEERIVMFARGGAMFAGGFAEAPTASITFGSAGAAVGLLRVAEVRSDPALVALADVWKSRAYRDLGAETACYNAAIDISPEVLGSITPYHAESGIHAAAALIAASRGDVRAQRVAVEKFIAASKGDCAELDLIVGRSSTLVGAALLLEVSRDLPESETLKQLGDRTLDAIWRELDGRPAIAENPAGTLVGMAHGWTGYAYAALRWCAASGAPRPSSIEQRLEQLAGLRVRRGRASYWRRQIGGQPEDVVPGWCNGSAGFVFLWTAAHRAFGEERYLRLAEEAAIHTLEEPAQIADLCCGASGRAYAVLNVYRHTGERVWLSGARRLANAATACSAKPLRANSLWKGELGVAVLIADLQSPENSRMPFFE